jgi:hypothetical protein
VSWAKINENRLVERVQHLDVFVMASCAGELATILDMARTIVPRHPAAMEGMQGDTYAQNDFQVSFQWLVQG